MGRPSLQRIDFRHQTDQCLAQFPGTFDPGCGTGIHMPTMSLGIRTVSALQAQLLAPFANQGFDCRVVRFLIPAFQCLGNLDNLREDVVASEAMMP